MRLIMLILTVFLGACATTQSGGPAVSILLDLDPASADRTVIVESITADKEGRLYLPERVTGNILRVDPKAPKAVAVGRIDAREIKGKKVDANPSGIAFNQTGDLFVATGPFSEVVRIRGADLNPAKPGLAQTFTKNGSSGPLEFPAAIVFVGNTGYIANFDAARRDSMDANGKTALDGIGPSIAQISP